MRILLIAPASGKWRGIARRKVFNGKTFRFSMLSLLTLAELAPEEEEVRIVDEQAEDVPHNEDFDLVGITAMTATAPRAYALADRFRARGVRVVLGGYHPTLNKQEALRHADSVVVGPAYGAWERLLEDLRTTGALKPAYHGDPQARVPARLPRRLVRRSRYLTVNATFATMGCRNACRFCSIQAFYKGARSGREPLEVAEEVAGFRERFLIFVDDNLTQDRDYAIALLRALAPLKKRWVAQVSVEAADDAELLGLMREAGCIGVFVGLETFSREALADQCKEIRPPERYREAVARFHAHGMFVESGVVFGFDTHTPEVFRNTLDMLERIGIDAVQISVLTPLPGTGLFRDMEPRVFDRDWEHYDFRHAVFTPRGMTAEQLQAGADWVIRKFYSPWRILRRAARWLGMPGGPRRILYPVGLNLAYYGRVRRFQIWGCDPAVDRPQEAVSAGPRELWAREA